MIADDRGSQIADRRSQKVLQESSVRIKNIMGYFSIAELGFPYDRRIANDRR